MSFKLFHSELVHHLFDELKRVLKSSVALNLKHHRYYVKLRLIGYVCEVILISVIFFRIKRKVNLKRRSLDVEFSALYSALVEGLEVPAASRLNTLVGKKCILNCGVVILHYVARLNKS